MPDSTSGSRVPTFEFALDWQGVTVTTGTANISLAMSLSGDADLGPFHTPPVCGVLPGDVNSDGTGPVLYQTLGAGQRDCRSPVCDTRGCNYTLSLTKAQAYTLQVHSLLYTSAGTNLVLLWTYVACSADQYSVLSGNDTVTCVPCPSGGLCKLEAAIPAVEVLNETTPRRQSVLDDIVVQGGIIANSGYWASTSSDGLTFYSCPIAEACLPGANGTRVQCRAGYAGVLCSVCDDQYFEQFGQCVACPASHKQSVAVMVALVCLFAVLGVVVFLLRNILPVDVMKLGVSMVQIIASGSTAYAIPWPASFQAFLNGLRVFLVDVISLTRASCAQPMTYFSSLVVVLVGFKILLALVLLAPLVMGRCVRSKRVQEAQVALTMRRQSRDIQARRRTLSAASRSASVDLSSTPVGGAVDAAPLQPQAGGRRASVLMGLAGTDAAAEPKLRRRSSVLVEVR